MDVLLASFLMKLGSRYFVQEEEVGVSDLDVIDISNSMAPLISSSIAGAWSNANQALFFAPS